MIINNKYKIWIENKKIHLNYKIIKKKIYGLKLIGWQARSIRIKKVIFKNSYIFQKKNNFFLSNVRFEKKNNNVIKILLKKDEINTLLIFYKKKNFSVIFSKILLHNNFFKIELAFVKGLKKMDKRYIEKLKSMKKKRDKNY